MTHSVGWTFSQNFSSLALPVWDWQCLEDIWTKGSVNQSVNDGGDCKTAPATPGLLNTKVGYVTLKHWNALPHSRVLLPSVLSNWLNLCSSHAGLDVLWLHFNLDIYITFKQDIHTQCNQSRFCFHKYK